MKPPAMRSTIGEFRGLFAARCFEPVKIEATYNSLWHSVTFRVAHGTGWVATTVPADGLPGCLEKVADRLSRIVNRAVRRKAGIGAKV